MKPYTKTYMDYFGYGQDDFIPCEVCGKRSSDCHHIRGRLGPDANKIENLMGLCREHHTAAHNEKLSKDYLQAIHDKFLKLKN